MLLGLRNSWSKGTKVRESQEILKNDSKPGPNIFRKGQNDMSLKPRGFREEGRTVTYKIINTKS